MRQRDRSAVPTPPSGGQVDFARGAPCTPHASTAKGDSISKIVSRLSPGDVVTTLKNTLDKVDTEWGVAEPRGRSLSERARCR
jgi:acyl-CoA hydrolase